MIHISVALVPLLSQMYFLEGHVLHLLKLPLELRTGKGKNSRSEQELLKPNEHSPLLQVVRLLTLVENLPQLLQVGVFEDLLDLIIHHPKKLVLVLLQFVYLLLDLVEVVLSKSRI